MSSDIVKRLRAGDTLDIGEAADRIEALEGEVAAMKTQQAADDEHAQKTIEVLSAFVTRAEEAEARAERLRVALHHLVNAVTYNEPPTMKFGTEAGLCYEARVPDQFVIDARKALEDDKQ